MGRSQGPPKVVLPPQGAALQTGGTLPPTNSGFQCPFQHCGYLKPQGGSLEFYTGHLTVEFRQLVYSSKASFIMNTTGLTHKSMKTS